MLRTLLALVITALIVWVVWPDRLASRPWITEVNPGFTGVFAPTGTLRRATNLSVGGAGPEDVARSSSGAFIVGVEGGEIKRQNAAGDFLSIGRIPDARPLGLALQQGEAGDTLWIAASQAGLYKLPAGGRLENVSRAAAGVAYGFADDVDIGASGRVYFSDATTRPATEGYAKDVLSGIGQGRLLRYDPAKDETEVLADGLFFANGVAVSADERFVLVAETARYRIKRVWLAGPRAGSVDIVIDNLPGYPDGISRADNGLFWVAMPAERLALADKVHANPFLKRMLMKLPEWLLRRLGDGAFGALMAITADGEVVHLLLDQEGDLINHPTSVEAFGDILAVGSLTAPHIVTLPLPQ